ncbi:MAG: methyltransferase domain-containing protein [Candidatus Aminicenantes bacterium]
MSVNHFIHMLACPKCQAQLKLEKQHIKCQQCNMTYPMINDIPIMLVDESFTGESGTSTNTAAEKEKVKQRFSFIDESLPKSFAPFVTFLNLGYVANDKKQYAVKKPKKICFNKYSVRLLFEVIGDYNLEGKTIIELGSGRGGNIVTISEYYNPQVMIGLDLSPTNIQFCQENLKLDNGCFIVGDVENIPSPDSMYDAVLNLESSHYYPDMFKFYHQVFRILKPEGSFLYADILPADMFKVYEEYLENMGFSILRNQDISSNVLLSCEEISKIRESKKNIRLYETFLVVPGSQVYEELNTGVKRYKILILKK